MAKRILITGVSGLIGKQLEKTLSQRGHEVFGLSRNPDKKNNSFFWDVYKQKIDSECLQGVDTIVHLAGEGIAQKKWTQKRKKQIIDSRVQSTHLLLKAIEEFRSPVKNFISASAVGYYGDCGDEILTEYSPNGYGFLANCCRQWEEAVEKVRHHGLRVVKLRTGFVLSGSGGGLKAFEMPIRLFAGAALGSGRQWVPWIHIDDLVTIYLQAIENAELEGTFNACAPNPVTNTHLIRRIAKLLNRPVWPFNIPEKTLKFILGEMSEVALMSSNTSVQKLLDTGFKFKYTNLKDALTDIYKKEFL